MRPVKFSISVFFALAISLSLKAQDTATSKDIFYSISGGYSFVSMKFLGKTPDSQTFITSIGLRKRIKTYSSGMMLYYSADLIPYIHFNYPKRDDGNRRSSRTGWGFSPVGFMFTNLTRGPVNPFIHTSGAFIFIEKEFPTDLSRKLNFTFDINVGLHIPVTDKTIFSFGYKFHHISNAQTGKQNPGLDSNFIFLSFSIL